METRVPNMKPVPSAYCDFIKSCMSHPDLYKHLPHPSIVETAKRWTAQGYTPESIADVICGRGGLKKSDDTKRS